MRTHIFQYRIYILLDRTYNLEIYLGQIPYFEERKTNDKKIKTQLL